MKKLIITLTVLFGASAFSNNFAPYKVDDPTRLAQVIEVEKTGSL
jgi:hypothetical protein